MSGKKKTILVVDDVPDDIVILEEILKSEYQIKAVTNGEAALRITGGDSPPDLILLDIMMPGMDGFEVCRRLKMDAEGAAIPVIFLTAKVMSSDEKAGLELGAVDYIRKPVDPDIVRARVKTHLEHKNQALLVSEVRYRRLFETAQDGIMIVDTRTGGIVDVNPSLAKMLGLSLEAFLGKRVSDFDWLRTIMLQQENLSSSVRQTYIRYRDMPLETSDGRKIYIEFTSNSYQVNHQEVMQVNIREITDLVMAEKERDLLSSALSHYLATSPTITYSFVIEGGAARWKWVSENVLAILGYSQEETLVPDWWFRHVNASDRAKALSISSDLAARETASREYRFMKKDRTVVWLHDEMRFLPGIGIEVEVVGTLTDITQRKNAEEEIHLKSAALEAAANAVVITDQKGIIRWANPAFGALTGYSLVETIGKNPKDLVGSEKQNADFYGTLWDTVLSGNVWSGRLVNRKKNGELYDEEMTITPFLDEERSISHFIAIKNDITENVLARQRLESALSQKVALLREIHHRVNNNMQVIISLLDLSAHDIRDEGLLGKLDDITRRMYAMAIVHKQFYEAEDLARIDFAVYLRQLLARIKSEFPESSKNATAFCEEGQALLHLEQAIPAALIVSELLTNALKFAFADGRETGTIHIEQRVAEDGQLSLSVSDDGVGLVPGFDPASAQSIGLTLVNILTEQLGGTISFRVGRGTAATLIFRIAPDPTVLSRIQGSETRA